MCQLQVWHSCLKIHIVLRTFDQPKCSPIRNLRLTDLDYRWSTFGRKYNSTDNVETIKMRRSNIRDGFGIDLDAKKRQLLREADAAFYVNDEAHCLEVITQLYEVYDQGCEAA